MKTQFFYTCRTLREVKQAYKSLALKHHPDRGGSESTMKQINLEYEMIINNPFYNFSGQTEAEKESYLKFPEVLAKIIHLEVTIEICGQWIWISGNTFKYKDYLKEQGFYFGKRKSMWYWRPVEYSSKNRKPLEMDKIRSIYGSDTVDTEKLDEVERRVS